jgi:limonene-1,2-epoxide hydrolase
METVELDAAEVVREFLLALQEGDLERSVPLLAEDVEWINVSLPTVHGRRAIERIFQVAQKGGGGFRVHFHAIASEGNVVLTQRTDAMTLGRFEHRFWVAGRFEVEEGQIVVWRDSFDWGDLLVGFLRGLLGVVSPGLNRRWPVANE